MNLVPAPVVQTYLDGAAAAPLHPVARQALLAALDDGWADPSRLYGAARRARLLLAGARAAVADCLGTRPDEITFTASGTQAAQLAVLGGLAGRRRAGGRFVHSAVEHSCVLHAAERHAAAGGEVEPVPVDRLGRVDAAGFAAAVARPGTALRARLAEMDAEAARLGPLVDLIRERVAATVPDVEVVGDPAGRLPHLVTFSCLYVDGEALLHELDRRGFAVSSGSSCASSTVTPSHVLQAMGVLSHGNVRVSLHRDTTSEDVRRFLAVLPAVVAELRRAAGVTGL